MSQTAQDPKTLAQKIAQQLKQEPLELLKSARSQVAGQEYSEDRPQQQINPDEQFRVQTEQLKAQDNAKSKRLIEAFQRELEDVRKQNLLKELQKKISEGEEVPLENYPELSIEHKQVLKAQMEAVKAQIQRQKQVQENSSFIEPIAKKGRQLFNFGKKTAVKREQQHVEKVQPPSG